MRDTSCVVVPIRDDAFFEQPALQSEIGHALLQIAGLTAQILHLFCGRGTCRIASEPALASLDVTP